jgi:protein-tyrosine phosphatase
VIDLHSHLLPGVDDGSRTVEQSVRVLTVLEAGGVATVACTPHLLASNIAGGWPAEYESAWTALNAVLPAGIRLVRGAEVMLDRPIPAAAGERKVTINGTRYLLVEFARMVPADIVLRALTEVTRLGLVPILAHPERYSSCSVESVRAWRNTGAVIQVDATTITQTRSRSDRARDLLNAGLADILAGDNHGDDRSLATAREWLLAHRGAEQCELLLETNPQAILDDRAVYEVDPLRVRATLWQSMRRIFDPA